MSQYTTVFNQMLQLLPRHRFETIVSGLQADRYVKQFTAWRQLVTLVYAQASGKESLREIEQGLETNAGRTYHLGLTPVKRSTLADANTRRSCQVYEGLFYRFLQRCHDLAPKQQFKFKNPLFSIDSTLIELCLASFPWARYRAAKGAMKLHYQYNHSGNIPDFLVMTEGLRHDVAVAKQIFTILPDSIYCLDRGYIDFEWFRRIHDEKAFFVTRVKKNMVYTPAGQHSEPNKKGVLADMLIQLNGFYTQQDYPFPLRLIRFYDAETDKELEFLTNNMKLSAATIARIYKARWQIELFFKWIKQNLKIKTFLGTSYNAVMTQIWIAMIYYLLLTYIKFQTRYKQSLLYLHRLIRETLLTNNTLIDLLRATERTIPKLTLPDPQLSFF